MKQKRAILSKLSEQELVSLYNESSRKEYFGELFLRNVIPIYGVLLKYLGDDEVVYNVVGQLFDEMEASFQGSVYNVDELKEWLHVNTVNYALRLKGGASQGASIEAPLPVRARELAGRLGRSDEDAMKMLDTEMDKLPKPQRVCLQQFFIQKRSYADIADDTGYLTVDVRSHIEKGLAVIASGAKGKNSGAKGKK